MKIIDLFSTEKAPSKLKPVEFCHTFGNGVFSDRECGLSPIDFDKVALIIKDTPYDIILAWDDNEPQDKILFQGHWNDGI